MTDFTRTRSQFSIPEDMIYLDGNSLGVMPATAAKAVSGMITNEWGRQLVTGWNSAGWYEQPRRVGDMIAPLIGAGPGQVVMGDTLSIKVFQAVSAALEMTDRKVILSDSGNFPSDLYVAQGLARAVGARLEIVAPEEVGDAITADIGVLMLTEVDYRSGRRHDMAALTALAHQVGAVTVWDLAHSAGAVDVDLMGCNADFAVGCTYKYLNGGPGAPGFIWVHPRHADQAAPCLQGWMGHDAPFDFDMDYRPAAGIERMRVGTPPAIALTALEEALKIWDGVPMQDIRAASLALTDRFIAGIEARCGDSFEIITPRDHKQRGSQVSLRHPQAYALIQALIAQGVVGDMRAPDVLRFGFTPLYIGEAEVDRAIDAIAGLIRSGDWDKPEFHRKQAVT